MISRRMFGRVAAYMTYGAGGMGRPRLDQELRQGPQRVIAPGGAAGTFRGKLVVVFGTGPNSGIFVYSPAPGFNNLVASITSSSGLDQYGNAYLAGETSYTVGATCVAVNMQLAQVAYLTAPGAGGPWTARGQLSLNVGTNGLNLSTGNGPIYLTAQGGNIVKASFGVEVTTPGGIVGRVPVAQVDHTLKTVSGTGLQALTTAWPIPAGDAGVDTTYRLTASGFGAFGTTPQNLTWAIGLSGSAIRSVVIAPPGGAGQSFRWRIAIDLHVLTTGAGGTADCSLSGTWGSAQAATAEAPITAGSPSQGAEAINTTTGNDLELMAAWAATTGGPSITCVTSTFERIGA